ncbi:MAG TPA: zf-HC2 domain-containing protein [Opitutaceae bacterium]|nr:zf-HC2 domain-containing protein [Opitutaceae bacterium]
MPSCQHITSLLIAGPDRRLTPAEQAEIEGHVVQCAACRQQRALLAAIPASLQTVTQAVSTPNPQQEWMRLRSQLPKQSREGKSQRRKTPFWLQWSFPIGAAATAVVVALVTHLRYSDRVSTERLAATVARADYVQAENADSTLVYVDQESGWLIVWADSSSKDKSG